MLKILISNILSIGLILTLTNEAIAQKTKSDAMISIGLLVNESNEKQAVEAANKVVSRINESGGVQGKKLQLESRLVKGSWGAGSSQIVDLVFKDKVVGVVGALDGRNAHLAEQVIAKTQVLYISAWASDPTLSKAYVSWYFSVVPTDDQQARLLTEAIERDHQGNSRILVVHDGSYDASQSFKSLRAALAENQNLSIQTLEILHSSKESEWLPKIEEKGMDAIVVLGSGSPILKINEALQGMYSKAPVMYLNLAASGSLEFENQISIKPDNILCISKPLAGNSKNSECLGRVEDYVKDGIMALIISFQNTDTDFSSRQKVLSEINFQGVTGQIEFDELGRLKNAENRLKINPPY